MRKEIGGNNPLDELHLVKSAAEGYIKTLREKADKAKSEGGKTLEQKLEFYIAKNNIVTHLLALLGTVQTRLVINLYCVDEDDDDAETSALDQADDICGLMHRVSLCEDAVSLTLNAGTMEEMVSELTAIINKTSRIYAWMVDVCEDQLRVICGEMPIDHSDEI